MHLPPVIPNLYAPDLQATIDYYVSTLGFEQTGSYEDSGKVIWAEVALGPARLWFFSQPISDQPQAVMSGWASGHGR